MAWPDRKYLEKEYARFLAGKGPSMVDFYVTAIPSIRVNGTGNLDAAFHRCNICGEHPEVMGGRAIELGKYREQKFCEYCVTTMYRKMMEVEPYEFPEEQ